jgi:branched-chain amino acid transport system substrate-binding protein
LIPGPAAVYTRAPVGGIHNPNIQQEEEHLIMRLSSRLGILASIVVLMFAIAACGGDDGSDSSGGGSSSSGENTATPAEGVTKDTINYGMIYDQTGPQTTAQIPWSHGFLTQIKKANEAGGINGRKINIVDIDEKSDVSTGIAGYKRLVSQTPVVGISGLSSSSVQEAALPLIKKDNMPLVGPQSTTKAGMVPLHPSVFYVVPPYSDQVDVIVGYMAKKLNNPKPRAAIFRLTAATGIEVAELFKARIEKAGGKIVSDQQMDVTATSADAQVQKIAAAKPDYLLLHTAPTQTAAVMKAMQKLGAKFPVISTFSGGGPTGYNAVPEEYGKLLEYTAAVTPSDIKVPGTDEMVADAKKYGYEDEVTNSAFTYGYISGLVVVEALKKAGADLNRETFIKALESIQGLDTGGLSEPVTYGPKDRAGLSLTRPYRFNYQTKKFEAVGEFEDYAEYVTNEYQPK